MGLLDKRLLGRPIGVSPRPQEQTLPADGAPPEPPQALVQADPTALECLSVNRGNDTFASRLTFCLEKITQTSLTEVDIEYSLQNRPYGDEGGFYFDPRVEIRVDGEPKATNDIWLDIDETVRKTASLSGLPTESVLIELAIIGDFAAKCWCVGPDELDCTVNSPTADCYELVERFTMSAPTVTTTCEAVTSSVEAGGTATARYSVHNEGSVEVVATVGVEVDGSIANAPDGSKATEDHVLKGGYMTFGNRIDFVAPSDPNEYDVDVVVTDVNEVPGGLGLLR